MQINRFWRSITKMFHKFLITSTQRERERERGRDGGLHTDTPLSCWRATVVAVVAAVAAVAAPAMH